MLVRAQAHFDAAWNDAAPALWCRLCYHMMVLTQCGCAPRLQVSAIKQGIAELRAGLKTAEAEVSRAADMIGSSEDAAMMAQFANMMAAFHTAAAAAVARTEVWLPVPAPCMAAVPDKHEILPPHWNPFWHSVVHLLHSGCL